MNENVYKALPQSLYGQISHVLTANDNNKKETNKKRVECIIKINVTICRKITICHSKFIQFQNDFICSYISTIFPSTERSIDCNFKMNWKIYQLKHFPLSIE